MTIALDRADAPARAAISPQATAVAIAGFFSLGAGAIHAAAIGVHAEHRPAALAFTGVATVQLVWGGLAMVRAGRLVRLSGMVLGLAAVAGWVIAKTSGISFIDGLDVAEPIQTVDALAAGLALAAAVVAGASWRISAAPSTDSRPRLLAPLAAFAAIAMTAYGMSAAGTHVHSHGEGAEVTTAGAAHDHGHEASAVAAPTDDASAAAPAGGEHNHESSAVAPVPYDPTKPIDLGGVPGVTPEQQAAAENEVAITLLRLPQWKDPAVAEAAGFHSIGDGFTGIEHFVNETFMNDDVILDPDKPESLVYSTTKAGDRTLVAAMYMVKPGTPLSDVPDVGGKLMQWHTHGNLCYKPDGKLGGLTDAQGNCAAGLIKPVETPMIHVWITPHKCGPFAALEGIGGGKIEAGETRLCDTAHGAH